MHIIAAIQLCFVSVKHDKVALGLIHCRDAHNKLAVDLGFSILNTLKFQCQCQSLHRHSSKQKSQRRCKRKDTTKKQLPRRNIQSQIQRNSQLVSTKPSTVHRSVVSPTLTPSLIRNLPTLCTPPANTQPQAIQTNERTSPHLLTSSCLFILLSASLLSDVICLISSLVVLLCCYHCKNLNILYALP